jgi:hypothetical protein
MVVNFTEGRTLEKILKIDLNCSNNPRQQNKAPTTITLKLHDADAPKILNF